MTNQPIKLLSKAFGLNRDEVWRDFAAEIGAEFIPGYFWGECKSMIRLQVDDSFIGMFISLSEREEGRTDTRVVSSFVSKSHFDFILRKKGAWNFFGPSSVLSDNDLMEMLHHQRFQMKTNDVVKAQILLSDEKTMSDVKSVFRCDTELKIRCEHWDEENNIYKQEIAFAHYGVIRDKKRLTEVFDIFRSIITTLKELDTTTAET